MSKTHCSKCEEGPEGPGWEIFAEYHDIEQGRVVECYVAEMNEALARSMRQKR